MTKAPSANAGTEFLYKEIKSLRERFTARTNEQRLLIKEYVGRILVVMGETYTLHDVNDLGYLYWRKKRSKKLWTLGYPKTYQVKDLPHIFGEEDENVSG